jgi:uncharacterized protein (DUF305 family)
MKKESMLYGVIGLLAGLLIAGAVAVVAVNSDNHGMMRMMGMNTNHSHKQESSDHSQMSMTDMTEQLKNKSGDEFDKAFIEMMIAHHEGAVAMARLIPDRAKHDQIKSLGEAIISAQTKEISEMRQWQLEWGYANNEMMQMMHSGH